MEDYNGIYESNVKFLRGESVLTKDIQDQKIHFFFALLALAFFFYSSVSYGLEGKTGSCLIFFVLFAGVLLYSYSSYHEIFYAIKATRKRLLLNGKVAKVVPIAYGESDGSRLTIDFASPAGEPMTIETDVDRTSQGWNNKAWNVGESCLVLYFDKSHFYAV